MTDTSQPAERTTSEIAEDVCNAALDDMGGGMRDYGPRLPGLIAAALDAERQKTREAEQRADTRCFYEAYSALRAENEANETRMALAREHVARLTAENEALRGVVEAAMFWGECGPEDDNQAELALTHALAALKAKQTKEGK